MSAAGPPPAGITAPLAGVGKPPKVSRWAYVLLVIGTLSLFDVLGLDSWGTPLVMIVIGVALITRPYPWGRQLALGLVGAALLVAGAWYVVRPAVGGVAVTETLDLPVTATLAEIDLTPSVGRLDVSAGQPGTLIAGTLELNRGERLERSVTVSGDAQMVRLGVRRAGANVVFFGRLGQDTARWLLTLAPDVPLVLRVTGGVGDATLDLSSLKVTDFTFEGGVGRAAISLPGRGIVSATLRSGVGPLSVMVPAGTEARVQVTPGVGAVTVLGDFRRSGDTYTSPGYAEGRSRIDLRVQGGVGSVTVTRPER